uniref:AraC family transcriptional regulator n=1 Tax=Bacteroides fragilis TaxID=817 RepID=UPI003563F444
MRNSTENIYQQKVNQVIDYISANLHLPLQLDVIADKINVSQRQLLRIMRSALNESLYAYVARQRIERAVLYMQAEDMSLTKLAEMVGYDNPQSFSKAFKKQFGISPKAYIDELQSRLEGYIQSSGNRSGIQSEVCHFEGLELVYIRIFGKYGEVEPYEIAWSKLMEFLKDNQALTPETRFIGLSFDDPNVTNHGKCRFYACASVQKKIIPTGEFGTIQLQQGKYAVYTLKGSCSGLQELYNHISVNFEYTIRHGMAFEEYISYRTENSKENITKIYMPIK